MLKQNEPRRAEAPATLEQKRQFLKLLLTERRRILRRQAEAAHHQYESELNKAEAILGSAGDLINY